MARSPKTLTAEQAWAACELVAESIPHIVWLSHPSGSTDYFNTRGTDYTGLRHEATTDGGGLSSSIPTTPNWPAAAGSTPRGH